MNSKIKYSKINIPLCEQSACSSPPIDFIKNKLVLLIAEEIKKDNILSIEKEVDQLTGELTYKTSMVYMSFEKFKILKHIIESYDFKFVDEKGEKRQLLELL